MELEEIEQDSGDTGNGIDSVLIGLGVAIIMLPIMFVTLVGKPSSLSHNLTGHRTPLSGSASKRVIGPGLFFVLSLIGFVLMMQWLAPGADSMPDVSEIEDRADFGAGYEIGKSFGGLMNEFEERLSSGNIWSAVVIIVPIYVFALVFAAINKMLVSLICKEWTTAHAVGSSLYMIGSLLLWFATLLVIAGFAPTTASPVIMGTVMGLGFLAALGFTAVQTYGFVDGLTDKPPSDWLGLISAATPLILMTMLGVLIAGVVT